MLWKQGEDGPTADLFPAQQQQQQQQQPQDQPHEQEQLPQDPQRPQQQLASQQQQQQQEQVPQPLPGEPQCGAAPDGGASDGVPVAVGEPASPPIDIETPPPASEPTGATALQCAADSAPRQLPPAGKPAGELTLEPSSEGGAPAGTAAGGEVQPAAGAAAAHPDGPVAEAAGSEPPQAAPLDLPLPVPEEPQRTPQPGAVEAAVVALNSLTAQPAAVPVPEYSLLRG